MKNVGQSIYYSPKFKKSIEWVKLIALTGTAQALVQALGLISGIFIIRLLPTTEYAFYTVANTTLGSLTVLADGGIATAVMAQGGKYWLDREKLGVVVSTGMDLRKKFGALSLIIAIPILFYLLLHHKASVLFSTLIVLSLVPAFYATLSDNLLEIAPKLTQDIKLLQKNQVITSIARLVLTTFSLFIFPWTFVAILASGIPRMRANLSLRRLSAKYVDLSQKPDPLIRSEILKIVRRSLPEIIYYCLSGQITIWLISIFGSTASVAQVGALGRISMALALVQILFGTLVIPRFARLPDQPKLLIGRFFKINLFALVLMIFVVAITWVFSNQLLWILGKNYQGLNIFLTLSMISACIALLIGVCFGLYSSRGHIINPFFSIPFNVGTIVCGLFLFNISNVRGVFLFNIFIGSLQLLLHFGYGIIKFMGK
jgi:hypothetical protein